MNITDRVKRELHLEGQHLIGCRRRGAWTDEVDSWRWLRGNAILATIGKKRTATTPAGPLQFYEYEGKLLQFRGGEYNSWWYEDILDLWCLAYTHGFEGLDKEIYLFQENKGRLNLINITIDPLDVDVQVRADKILHEASLNPPARISKAGPRAMKACRYCPVKMRCDATDKLARDTDDWSPSYQKTQP